MGNITQIVQGVRSVTWKGVDLGHTKDGITFSYMPSYSDITVDEYGETPLDKVLTGQKVEVTVALAESSVQNIRNAITHSTLQTGTNGERIVFGSISGQRLRAIAGELRMHPINKATNDKSQDIVLHLAAPSDQVELSYKVDEQTVVELKFAVFIDESKPLGAQIGYYGVDSVS